jgi:chromosome segregation ATPase
MKGSALDDSMEDLVKKRESLENRKAKLTGKLEAAKSSLSEIDNQLKEMGLNPNDLELEISRLKRERQVALNNFTSALNEAEQVISTIENRIKTL